MIQSSNLKDEFWTGVDFKEIFRKICLLGKAAQYSSFVKFLDLTRPYFVKYNCPVQSRYFFRVRAHTENNFFQNISDISYRHDLFDIHKFGRCNSPFESLFYCSNNPMLAVTEVIRLTKAESRKKILYHTTSIWKQKQPLNITPIFEPPGIRNKNRDLDAITKNSIDVIKTLSSQIQVKDLIRFQKLVGKEFTRPFSSNNNIYLFSAAISSYLLNPLEYKREKIDGLIYPTCIEDCKFRTIGLNYAFNPLIIGFNNKIELETVYRSKMEKIGVRYYETEIQFFKKINRFTGQIIW